MCIKVYENQVIPQETSFLNDEKYVFSVLIRILEGPCTLTITDGKRLVICLSAYPYPVWVWLPDDASERELEKAYQLLKKYFGNGKYRFNMKHPHAQYLIKRSEKDGGHLSIQLNMLAYTCPTVMSPLKKAPGHMVVARDEHFQIVKDMIARFHLEASTDPLDNKMLVEQTAQHIANGTFYLWMHNGQAVACCSRRESEDQCSISSVYTEPGHRRKGYASNLVYEVANFIQKSGKTPSLYTDAGYTASNACYQQVGFKVCGSLCTIG